jgi:hypothetical protein
VYDDKSMGAGGAPLTGIECMRGVTQLIEQLHFIALGFARCPLSAPTRAVRTVAVEESKRFGLRHVTLRRALSERNLHCFGCCCWHYRC